MHPKKLPFRKIHSCITMCTLQVSCTGAGSTSLLRVLLLFGMENIVRNLVTYLQIVVRIPASFSNEM